MLFSLVLGHICEMKRNFEYLVKETNHEHLAEWFSNYKKQIKLKNHDITHGVMVSYMEVVLEQLRRFWSFCHVRYLQTEASEKKILSVQKDLIKLRSK
jgi:hypothetical protein